MTILHPFQIGSSGGISKVKDTQQYISQVIQQVLMTYQGERINRPEFGTTINHAIFRVASEVGEAQQFSLQASLQQWVGHLAQIISLTFAQNDATLQVEVHYVERNTEEKQRLSLTIHNIPLG